METIRIIFEPGYSKTDDAEGLNNDRFIHDLEEMVTHRAENGQRLKAVYLDIIQEPGLKEDHTVQDRHKQILPRYSRVRNYVDTLEIQYRSSKWEGGHAEHDCSSWIHDWDLGALQSPC